MFKTLDTYNKRYQLTTIHEILHRYAPSSENQTHSYINSVCKEMAKLLKAPIHSTTNVWQANKYTIAFIAAIIKHENGFNIFNTKFIEFCTGLKNGDL